MIEDSRTEWSSLLRGMGATLLLLTWSLSPDAVSQVKPLYRSEAILQVEELNNRPAEDQEKILENLKARLTDWSVLKSAVRGTGQGQEDLRKEIGDSLGIEIIEDDRFRIWLDLDDRIACDMVMSALMDRIVSEGIEIEESDRLAFLRGQLEEVRERMEKAKSMLDDFAGEHARFLLEDEMTGEMARDRIRVSSYRLEEEEAKARKRFLQRRLRKTQEFIVASTVVEYGPEVRKLKHTIAAKEEKLNAVRSKHGEGPKTEKLGGQISELKLKLDILEERSPKEEIRSLNPLYREIEAELVEEEDLIRTLKEDIEKAQENVKKNKRLLKGAVRVRREKGKLDRNYNEALALFEALQDKLEEEYVLERLEGGELEVTLLAGPSKPESAQKMSREGLNQEK